MYSNNRVFLESSTLIKKILILYSYHFPPIMNSTSNLLFVTVPKSVEQLSKQLQSKIVNPLILQTLIDFSVRYWKGEEICHKEWEALLKNSYLPLTMIENLFSGVLNLTLAVFQIPEKLFTPELVLAELIQFGLAVEQAEQITKLKITSAPNIPKLPKLNNVKWRIDVTISTSDVSRILEPWILMEINLESGDQKTVHIPVAQFHSLRYQVASCLNQFSKMPV